VPKVIKEYSNFQVRWLEETTYHFHWTTTLRLDHLPPVRVFGSRSEVSWGFHEHARESMNGTLDAPAAQALSYEYSPLPSPTVIRLVEFEPSSDGAISITLFSTKLEDAPLFDALSYTWGSPQSPVLSASTTAISWDTADIPIFCNGKRLFIASNLKDALCMLQKTDWISENVPKQRYIWIDALCIDQTNLSEREAQVSLMGELFRKATTVIAWLGDEDCSTSDAFTVVDRLSSVAQERLSSVKTDDFLVAEAYSQKLGITPVLPMQWLAFICVHATTLFQQGMDRTGSSQCQGSDISMRQEASTMEETLGYYAASHQYQLVPSPAHSVHASQSGRR
jgi:Heterokaryon incompatibility protein (HET)